MASLQYFPLKLEDLDWSCYIQWSIDYQLQRINSITWYDRHSAYAKVTCTLRGRGRGHFFIRPTMDVIQRRIRLKEGLVMQYCCAQVALNRTFSIACEGLHWVAYMYSTNLFFFQMEMRLWTPVFYYMMVDARLNHHAWNRERLINYCINEIAVQNTKTRWHMSFLFVLDDKHPM